jgi:hypothetical protein
MRLTAGNDCTVYVSANCPRFYFTIAVVIDTVGFAVARGVDGLWPTIAVGVKLKDSS